MCDSSRDFSKTLQECKDFYVNKETQPIERPRYFLATETGSLGEGTLNPYVKLQIQTNTRFLGDQLQECEDRCLVADKDFKVGDVVLISRPAVHPVIHTHNKHNVCSYCLSLPELGQVNMKAVRQAKMLRCSRCQYMKYCSKVCQQADWKKNHKVECAAIPIIQRELPGERLEQVLLCGRVLRQCENLSSKKSDTCDNVASPWSMLLHEDTSGSARERYSTVHSIMLETNLLKNQEDTVGRVSGMMQRFDTNNFSVTSPTSSAIAEGVYPVGALVNHNCRPNTVLSYGFSSGKKKIDQEVVLTFRCVEPIATGAEIHHCYTDMFLPPWERKDRFKRVYRFRCDCVYCRSTKDTPPELSVEERSRLELADRLVVEALGTDDTASEIEKLRTAYEIYYSLIGFFHQASDALHMLLAAAYENSDFETAAFAAENLTRKTFYRLALHPLTASEAQVNAEVQRATSGAPAACEMEMLALYIYSVTQGSSSPNVKVVLDRLARTPDDISFQTEKI